MIMISNVLMLVVFSLVVLTYIVPVIDICGYVNSKLKTPFSYFIADILIFATAIALLFYLTFLINT